MSKKRLIDTEGLLYDADLVNMLGVKGLWLYVRLWSISEDWGGYEPNYFGISKKMGAVKMWPWSVKKCIKKLIKSGKIIPYIVDGKTYHWCANFHKHQTLKNPPLPKLPLPDWVIFEEKQRGDKRKYAIYTVLKDKIPVPSVRVTCNSPGNVELEPEPEPEVSNNPPTPFERGKEREGRDRSKRRSPRGKEEDWKISE